MSWFNRDKQPKPKQAAWRIVKSPHADAWHVEAWTVTGIRVNGFQAWPMYGWRPSTTAPDTFPSIAEAHNWIERESKRPIVVDQYDGRGRLMLDGQR